MFKTDNNAIVNPGGGAGTPGTAGAAKHSTAKVLVAPCQEPFDRKQAEIVASSVALYSSITPVEALALLTPHFETNVELLETTRVIEEQLAGRTEISFEQRNKMYSSVLKLLDYLKQLTDDRSLDHNIEIFSVTNFRPDDSSERRKRMTTIPLVYGILMHSLYHKIHFFSHVDDLPGFAKARAILEEQQQPINLLYVAISDQLSSAYAEDPCRSVPLALNQNRTVQLQTACATNGGMWNDMDSGCSVAVEDPTFSRRQLVVAEEFIEQPQSHLIMQRLTRQLQDGQYPASAMQVIQQYDHIIESLSVDTCYQSAALDHDAVTLHLFKPKPMKVRYFTRKKHFAVGLSLVRDQGWQALVVNPTLLRDAGVLPEIAALSIHSRLVLRNNGAVVVQANAAFVSPGTVAGRIQLKASPQFAPVAPRTQNVAVFLTHELDVDDQRYSNREVHAMCTYNVQQAAALKTEISKQFQHFTRWADSKAMDVATLLQAKHVFYTSPTFSAQQGVTTEHQTLHARDSLGCTLREYGYHVPYNDCSVFYLIFCEPVSPPVDYDRFRHAKRKLARNALHECLGHQTFVWQTVGLENSRQGAALRIVNSNRLLLKSYPEWKLPRVRPMRLFAQAGQVAGTLVLFWQHLLFIPFWMKDMPEEGRRAYQITGGRRYDETVTLVVTDPSKPKFSAKSMAPHTRSVHAVTGAQRAVTFVAVRGPTGVTSSPPVTVRFNTPLLRSVYNYGQHFRGTSYAPPRPYTVLDVGLEAHYVTCYSIALSSADHVAERNLASAHDPDIAQAKLTGVTSQEVY